MTHSVFDQCTSGAAVEALQGPGLASVDQVLEGLDHFFLGVVFTIETFDDPETGKPTQYGRFSRNWQDEEALDVLIDKLEAGQLSGKQALMQARKLEASTPYNLEI